MDSTVKAALAAVMVGAIASWVVQATPQTQRADAGTLEADRGASTPLRLARAPADVQDTAEDSVLDSESPNDGDGPSLRALVPPLSPNAVDVVANGQRYWYDDGRWYVEQASGLSAVQPPVGVVVPTLPFSATTTWFGAVPYACASGVCYVPAPRGYAVAEPPPSQPS
jgi:hypothetical protein